MQPPTTVKDDRTNSIAAFIKIEIHADTRGAPVYVLVLQPAIDKLMYALAAMLDKISGTEWKFILVQIVLAATAWA